MNSLPAYEFFVALGIVAACFCLFIQNKHFQFFKNKSLFWFVIGAFVSGFWGARVLGDWVQAALENRLNWGRSFDLLFLDKASGPVVYYGGLLALIYYIFLVARFKKISFLILFDLCVPALLLGHALGRLGCWARGCCFGSSCPYPWGLTHSLNSTPLHPVQLYEAFGLLLLGFISFKRPFKNLPRNSILFLLLYPSFRFFLEFVRGDEVRGFWLSLSTSQWISFPLFVLGLILWIQGKRGAATRIVATSD